MSLNNPKYLSSSRSSSSSDYPVQDLPHLLERLRTLLLALSAEAQPEQSEIPRVAQYEKLK